MIRIIPLYAAFSEKHFIKYCATVLIFKRFLELFFIESCVYINLLIFHFVVINNSLPSCLTSVNGFECWLDQH